MEPFSENLCKDISFKKAKVSNKEFDERIYVAISNNNRDEIISLMNSKDFDVDNVRRYLYMAIDKNCLFLKDMLEHEKLVDYGVNGDSGKIFNYAMEHSKLEIAKTVMDSDNFVKGYINPEHLNCFLRENRSFNNPRAYIGDNIPKTSNNATDYIKMMLSGDKICVNNNTIKGLRKYLFSYNYYVIEFIVNSAFVDANKDKIMKENRWLFKYLEKYGYWD